MKRILRRFYSIIPLNNRKYIEINGKDTKKFLQGLITNDINSLTKENSVIVSALLNPKVFLSLLFSSLIIIFREEL